jgi:flagellar hook protein FlgE
MSRALLSALGGLRAHQDWIDVIGSNLANSSTNGFKSSRALFSSILSQTLLEGSPPSNTLGGTNPMQIGLGTSLAVVDRDVTQGTLGFTGRTFDLAMRGNGYFAVSDGQRNLYTRVGAFGLDAERNMVDQRTGFRVLDDSGSPFRIDTNANVAPRATSEVNMIGNLPAEVGGPLAEILNTSNSIMDGTPALLTGSIAPPGGLLTGLTPSTTYSMTITANGSAAQTIALTSSAAGEIQMTDVVNEINTNVNGVTAALNGAGQLELTSDRTGEASTILVTPSTSGTDLAATLGLQSGLQTGTQSTATSLTALNALPSNLVDYVDGDQITVSGTDADGSVVSATFTYGATNDGTTVGDLVAFLDNSFPESSVAFDAASGQISVTANEGGEAAMALVITDGAGNTGAANWAANAFSVSTQGTGPDMVETSIQVYDSAGLGHIVNFTLERIDDNTWQMSTSLPDGSGAILNGGSTTVTFADDGTLQGSGDSAVTVQFTGSGAQSIDLSFSGIGSVQGVTQFGGATSLVADFQDGYPAGSLSSLSVNADGSVTGFYSNGQTFDLGQFGVASFPNERGLSDIGNGFFAESGNSGQLRLGSADFGGVGEVVGGALEESNVNTAEEFVRLIQAQRGFQANARIISIQDQLLEEAVNII